MVKRFVQNLLGDLRLQRLVPDSPGVLRMQAGVIREKPFLRKLYEEWYRSISRMIPSEMPGPVLELGSGGGFLNEILPGVIRSDILTYGNSDILLDGMRLPVQNGSLKAIVMVDVFHHLPAVEPLSWRGRQMHPARWGGGHDRTVAYVLVPVDLPPATPGTLRTRGKGLGFSGRPTAVTIQPGFAVDRV